MILHSNVVGGDADMEGIVLRPSLRGGEREREKHFYMYQASAATDVADTAKDMYMYFLYYNRCMLSE